MGRKTVGKNERMRTQSRTMSIGWYLKNYSPDRRTPRTHKWLGDLHHFWSYVNVPLDVRGPCMVAVMALQKVRK